MPNEVNSQITDSVVQAATAVIGPAPAQTTGMLDAVMAETIGMAMYNAVTTQQNSQMVASAAIAAACARMLKAPNAAPLTLKLVAPVVTGVTPSPAPVSQQAQDIQITGTNFQPNLSVDVFDPSGAKVGTLSGTRQITSVTATSLSAVANFFTVEGSYGVEVINPDGGRSSRYPITVEAMPPAISNVQPGSTANSFVVTGTQFESGLNAVVSDHTGTILAGTVVSSVTPATFTMVTNPGTSTGPFSVQVVNPDGGSSNSFLFVSSTPTQ